MRATFCNCDVGDSLLQTILDHRVFHIFLLRFHANIPSSCLDDADFVVMIRPLKFVFLGTRWPMLGSHRRCSEEIVDAAIVSARLITLHPDAESSSIT